MKKSKFNLFLLMFIILILVYAGITTAYAAEVTVSLPTFDVTINGVKIDDEYRQYPFIVYKDITYFPMTYFDSRFLGLITEWDELKGLEIYITNEEVEYEPYKQNMKNSNKYIASINAYNYQEEDSSRIYKVDIITGETALVDESDNLNYFKISSFLQEESINVFSPYYELLDFKVSDYKENILDGNVESIFNYTVIHKNYDKDPNTVEYIKEAKERNDSNYQKLYDEYLQPKEMNFQLKTIINKDNLITLFSNFSPKGTDWKEIKMSDFITGK